MKKKGDVKFIIYQSLYIFVVCVIAIKGANLDLVQVVADDGKVRAEITPDSLIKLQELLSKSLIVDSSLFVVVPKELLKEDERLRQIVQNMPKIDLNNYMPKVDMSQYVKVTPEQQKILDQKKEEPSQMQEIRIGNISLTQYTSNTLNNPYDVPLEIVGITSIPPKSSKTFETGGQSSVVIKVGSSSKTVELKPNEKPKINIQSIASMGENARVTSLQSSVCFRVTINDDFPGQLDVKINGPVTFKQVSATTFDVTMNAFSSKAAFDNFTEGKDSPYSLGFTVSVKDKIAGHSITAQQSFRFGEW
jgi:hypothetical protein